MLKTHLENIFVNLKATFRKRHVNPNLLFFQRQILNDLRDSRDVLIVMTDKNLGPAVIERDVYTKRVFNDHLLKNDTYRRIHHVHPCQAIHIPFTVMKKLMATRYWHTAQVRTSQTTVAADLADAELGCTVTRLHERKERNAVTEDVSLTKPPFQSDFENWQAWWDSWDNYLEHIISQANIPLKYIYQAHSEVTNEMRAANYTMSDEMYMATTKF
jgi:hypothetical protein